MKKSQIAVVGVTALLLLALFAYGALARSEEVMGVVAAKRNAAIVVDDQADGDRTVTLTEVAAPDDAFVVVHGFEAGMPGKRLGSALVEKGITRNLKIELDPGAALTAEVVAALHVDRGIKRTFEFDMKDPTGSPDKPIYVAGAPVAARFRAAGVGISAKSGEASISVRDQQVAGDRLRIDRAVSPDGAWIVVHLEMDGKPGDRVGVLHIDKGETRDALVQLDDSRTMSDKLLVGIHADGGIAGEFEFDMMDPVGSPDQPYTVRGKPVLTRASIR